MLVLENLLRISGVGRRIDGAIRIRRASLRIQRAAEHVAGDHHLDASIPAAAPLERTLNGIEQIVGHIRDEAAARSPSTFAISAWSAF